jgi:acyl-homoserine lactone synthase
MKASPALSYPCIAQQSVASMMEPVSRENAHLYGPELEQMFRMRHRVFVERLRWEALRKSDGVEKDQFDTDDAIYLLLMDEGVVVGGHRLLPTLKPHLFSELFPHLCDVRGVQRDAQTYELNRTCVDLVSLPESRLLWARRANMLGLMEFCVRAGIPRLSVLTAPHFITHYLRLGWEITPLGVPTELEGETQVAVIIHCNEKGLASMRQAYEMPGSLLRAVGMTLPALASDSAGDDAARAGEAVH